MRACAHARLRVCVCGYAEAIRDADADRMTHSTPGCRPLSFGLSNNEAGLIAVAARTYRCSTQQRCDSRSLLHACFEYRFFTSYCAPVRKRAFAPFGDIAFRRCCAASSVCQTQSSRLQGAPNAMLSRRGTPQTGCLRYRACHSAACVESLAAGSHGLCGSQAHATSRPSSFPALVQAQPVPVRSIALPQIDSTAPTHIWGQAHPTSSSSTSNRARERSQSVALYPRQLLRR